MRLELREAATGDVVAQIDRDLPGGEVVRDGSRLLVGYSAELGLDGLRQSAALAARSLRRTGGTIAWQVTERSSLAPADQVRALVEGTAFGAYDPGLRKSGYADRPDGRTRARRRPVRCTRSPSARPSSRRTSIAPRDLANLPPNELTPVALAEHALELRHPHLSVESHGRDWIEAQGWARSPPSRPGAARSPS